MAAITLQLYGSLKDIAHLKAQAALSSVEISGPIGLGSLLTKLNIPEDLVQVVMQNHRAVPLNTIINPGDRVALFPKEYPFFPDWLHLRKSH